MDNRDYFLNQFDNSGYQFKKDFSCMFPEQKSKEKLNSEKRMSKLERTLWALSIPVAAASAISVAYYLTH
jgi:hypothetical protein